MSSLDGPKEKENEEMNLYKIKVAHSAPKDTHESIQCYLIAESDEKVYEWLKAENKDIITCWDDAEEENKKFDIYNEEYETIGTETFKEKIIRLKGEINDEDYDFSDAYYGITLYGWENLGFIEPEHFETLDKFKIVEVA